MSVSEESNVSKTRNINIRVSEKQLEIIRENAKQRNMKLTEYVISRAVTDNEEESFTDKIVSLVHSYTRGNMKDERTDTDTEKEENT